MIRNAHSEQFDFIIPIVDAAVVEADVVLDEVDTPLGPRAHVLLLMLERPLVPSASPVIVGGERPTAIANKNGAWQSFIKGLG